MLEPIKDGEMEPYKGLREKLVELCRIHRLGKQMAIMKELAREIGVRKEKVIAAWELMGCPDVTTEEGCNIVKQQVKRSEQK